MAVWMDGLVKRWIKGMQQYQNMTLYHCNITYSKQTEKIGQVLKSIEDVKKALDVKTDFFLVHKKNLSPYLSLVNYIM